MEAAFCPKEQGSRISAIRKEHSKVAACRRRRVIDIGLLEAVGGVNILADISRFKRFVCVVTVCQKTSRQTS
jgi:hypothetical protein